MGIAGVLVAGCSGSSAGDAPATPSPPPSSAVATGGADNGAQEAGVDPSNPGTPVASVEATVGMSDDPKAKIKVDVLSLKRKDKLLLATMRVTPTNTTEGPQALFNLLGGAFWEPQLIDSVNLKAYSVVDGGRSLASSVTGTRAASGQPMYLYAVFAAPPPEVTRMSLLFAGSVPTLTDVPLS